MFAFILLVQIFRHIHYIIDLKSGLRGRGGEINRIISIRDGTTLDLLAQIQNGIIPFSRHLWSALKINRLECRGFREGFCVRVRFPSQEGRGSFSFFKIALDPRR